jgi:hypothetical protein
MKNEHKCWDFVMSSFVRTYGLSKVMNDPKFHIVALEWCDDNNYVCDISLDSLVKVDSYFKNVYEMWEN